jgi:uncharacterized protein with ParB-like and HNH nuclease domain
MAELKIDQKNVLRIFADELSDPDYLIPDYQRPYTWGIEECQTLWDDLFTYAFP